MRSFPFVILALGMLRQKLKVKQSYTVRAFLKKQKQNQDPKVECEIKTGSSKLSICILNPSFSQISNVAHIFL